MKPVTLVAILAMAAHTHLSPVTPTLNFGAMPVAQASTTNSAFSHFLTAEPGTALPTGIVAARGAPPTSKSVAPLRHFRH